jgi:hypothetical protein
MRRFARSVGQFQSLQFGLVFERVGGNGISLPTHPSKLNLTPVGRSGLALFARDFEKDRPPKSYLVRCYSANAARSVIA